MTLGFVTSVLAAMVRFPQFDWKRGPSRNTLAEATGSLRELTPKKGDRVTILENWLGPDPADSSQSVWYTEEGATLTFGDDNFTWTDAAAPKGEYQIGFIAEDFDGNWYEAHTTLTVK